jgi:hypothetical protein
MSNLLDAVRLRFFSDLAGVVDFIPSRQRLSITAWCLDATWQAGYLLAIFFCCQGWKTPGGSI